MSVIADLDFNAIADKFTSERAVNKFLKQMGHEVGVDMKRSLKPRVKIDLTTQEDTHTNCADSQCIDVRLKQSNRIAQLESELKDAHQRHREDKRKIKELQSTIEEQDRAYSKLSEVTLQTQSPKSRGRKKNTHKRH